MNGVGMQVRLHDVYVFDFTEGGGGDENVYK